MSTASERAPSGVTIVGSRPALTLALSTFGILALEIALIRWMSGQIRVFAYFSNLVLLAAFLGMGLGVALGRRRPQLVHLAAPALALLSALLAFSPALGLVNMHFPDASINLWGNELESGLLGFAGACLLVVALFWAVAGVFLLAAAPVGWLFDQLPPLTAYSADLIGSLAGVLTLTALAALRSPPPIWMAAAILPLVLLSRRPITFLFGAAVLVFAFLSIDGAVFSPYNRIDLRPLDTSGEPPALRARTHDLVLSANRDFHQHLLDLSNDVVMAAPENGQRQRSRLAYDIPFRARGPARTALVVGAGTGNDVAAALRFGYEKVTSVEIDPVILEIGARLHPEHPYANPRVEPVVNDARAFFEQNPNERFDVVCYGLLDSHAMFSAMSSLRLETYVYTVEGIRSGWNHVAPGGVLAISFSIFAGDWMARRMLGIVREATGQEPMTILHRKDGGVSLLVSKGRPLDAKAIFPGGATPVDADPSIRIPTDDWPFTYLRPGSVPYAYIVVPLLIALTAWGATRRAFSAGGVASPFDGVLFLMGAAFMLVETRMVTELSLLFGSTWIVNASVFAGILAMVLVANVLVARRAPARVELWYVPLAASLLLTWAIGAGRLNRLPLLTRGIVGGVVFALPIAFAGVVFSTLLLRSKSASGSLGSNLIGGLIGGLCEYTSMVVGLRSLALLALALYLGSLVLLMRRGSPPWAGTPS